MSIQFKFHPEKAVEAAGIFLKLHGKPMKYLGLLKLLYLADRMALEQLEQPITGDRYIATDDGLILSNTYDLLKGKPVDDALLHWSKFISSNNEKQVILLRDPGVEELCEAEEEIIHQVYQTFGHLDPLHVTAWTHHLPEWQNPQGLIIPIPVEDVLKTLGKSAEEISEIQQEALRETYLDGVLNG
jgi:uncharacterized phage-associated protein